MDTETRIKKRKTPFTITLRKLTIPALFITVTLLLLLSGCGFLEEQQKVAASKTEIPEEKETVFAVNTTTTTEGEINNYLQLNGDVEPETTVDAYPDNMGKLIELNIDLGSYVRKDQIIAKVDPSKPGMTFVASPVKAPISGTVVDVPVQLGATITQSTPIAKISRTNDLKITTAVAEKFISKIKIGLYAYVRFEAFPGEQFRARITELSPVVDPQSRTLEITLILLERDNRIKPGMFAEIKVITEAKKGIVKVPAEALVERFGEYFIFVVKDNNTVEKRTVVPGIEIDNKLEIMEGLSPDETVVVRGQSLLEDKAKIKVVGTVEPLPQSDEIN